MDRQLFQPYCEFLSRLGHKVVPTESAIWVDVRPGIFQPAASFEPRAITATELSKLQRHKSVFAWRWFSEPSGNEGTTVHSGPVVYNVKPPYDFSSLNQKARNQTRRGLENMQVRRVNLDSSVEQQCYGVYEDNLNRLRLLQRKGQIESKWRRWTAAIKSNEHVELWTAWNRNDLAAFAVMVNTPWGTEIVLQRSGSARGLYPNNALVYEMVRDSFNRGAKIVSFGLSAYSAASNGLDHFKQGMGFQALPLEEHYSWNALLRPFSPLLNPERVRSLYRFISR